jgi:histidine ammonia-lyase
LTIFLDAPLTWTQIAAVAHGERLELSRPAWERVDEAAALVAACVERGDRAYGITTGVGALADTVVDRKSQARLSRNIVLSHACGVGSPLDDVAVRAIMAAQVNNLAHGYSGVRPVIAMQLLALLDRGATPVVPSLGSAGYLTHCAHIASTLIGEGHLRLGDEVLPARDALDRLDLAPLELGAKEGLSLVNGTACSTGLACLALARARQALDWADATAALSLEALGCQVAAFDEDVLALRRSAGLQQVGETLRRRLAGSVFLQARQGERTQDALSLRAIPHVHGMARDVLRQVGLVVDDELAAVTDNPVVLGTAAMPRVASQAHAVAPSLAHALDSCAIALAQLAVMSERRTDRLVNPLVSGLPAFLAADPGAGSGLMIAQYTACALAGECRRLAMPASLDGGVTSALQEDFLAHPTAAAVKLHALLERLEQIVGIELVAACAAQDAADAAGKRAPANERLHAFVRQAIERYTDDRQLGPVLESAADMVRTRAPPMTWQESRG